MERQDDETALQRQLKQRMGAAGLTAKKLSLTAGIGASAVSEILRSRTRNPRLETLEALAKALDCTVSGLLGETGGPSGPIVSAGPDAADQPAEIEWMRNRVGKDTHVSW